MFGLGAGDVLNAGVGAFSAFSSSKASKAANAANIQIAREQMAFSAQEAKKQMEFQERMSNTAHQRQIADLKAAGLNPLLSAQYGGSSTPTGSMGTSAGATMEPVQDPLVAGMTKGVSSALEWRRFKQELKLMKEQEQKTYWDREVRREEGESIYESRKGMRLENEMLQMRNQWFRNNPWAFKLNVMTGGINSAAGLFRALK